MVGSAVLFVLRMVDRALQILVPAAPRRIAWISEPDYVGNAFHLYRHALTTRTGLEHVWLVADPGARPRIEAEFQRWSEAVDGAHTLRVIDRHSLRGYLAFLRSRYVFHTHGVYRTTQWSMRRDIVSLWHGMPIKCIGALNTVTPNPVPTYGTRHIATSAMYRYVIAAAFRANPDDVLTCGLPRCDVLAKPHPLALDKAAFLPMLDIPGTRFVFWLPTYRTASSRRVDREHTFLDDLPEGFLDRLDDAAGRAQCTVVVKLHPFDLLNNGDLNAERNHIRVIRSGEWLERGIELYDALTLADGVISDISSVLIDMVATKTPIGVVGFDEEAYNRDVVVPVDAIHTSARTHDLEQGDELTEFFQLIADGTGIDPSSDDLSAWLYDVELESGSETVLQAVGLRPVTLRWSCPEDPSGGGRGHTRVSEHAPGTHGHGAE